MEEQDEGERANTGPAVERAGGKAAPLVQDEPDGLLSKEVGVSAVRPHARGDEASIQISLGESCRDLACLEVLVLGGLVVCSVC